MKIAPSCAPWHNWITKSAWKYCFFLMPKLSPFYHSSYQLRFAASGSSRSQGEAPRLLANMGVFIPSAHLLKILKYIMHRQTDCENNYEFKQFFVKSLTNSITTGWILQFWFIVNVYTDLNVVPSPLAFIQTYNPLWFGMNKVGQTRIGDFERYYYDEGIKEVFRGIGGILEK